MNSVSVPVGLGYQQKHSKEVVAETYDFLFNKVLETMDEQIDYDRASQIVLNLMNYCL